MQLAPHSVIFLIEAIGMFLVDVRWNIIVADPQKIKYQSAQTADKRWIDILGLSDI